MPVERLSLDVLHDDEVDIALAPELVHLDDVAVAHGSCQPRLVEEHAPALLVEGEIRGQDLDGDGAVENGVFGLPNHTHPTLADLLDEAVVGKHLVALDSHETLRVHPEVAWLAAKGILAPAHSNVDYLSGRPAAKRPARRRTPARMDAPGHSHPIATSRAFVRSESWRRRRG